MKRTVTTSAWACCLLAVFATACGGAKNGGSDAPNGDQTSAPAGFDLATTVSGLPEDGKVTSDKVEIGFALGGADAASEFLKLDHFECRASATAEWKTCTVSPLALNSLHTGQVFDMLVRAVVIDTRTGQTINVAETALHFSVEIPGQAGDDPTPSIGGLSSKPQVGDDYQVTIPVGMHATEYSTTKTTGVMSFYRVLPESDPYYLYNASCDQSWDRVVASAAPSGQALTYCHSTPTRAQYKRDNEFRLANNHIEIATDARLVSETNHERISLSIFDEDFEFMNANSRFWNACNHRDIHRISVPMIPNFFAGNNPEHVDFFYCEADQPGVDGSRERWQVGAFLDLDHYDWVCESCSYPRAIEVVYEARLNTENGRGADLAKAAQDRILEMVKKISP
jgi:hypothetical protein